MSKIKNIISRQILDSRGRPTIEVDIFNEKGESARAAVPSGASVGRFEAIELRDGWKDFNGLGVQKVINNIQNIIKPALLGLDSLDQDAIDLILLKLDNSENKSNLGANAILATSIANAKLAALSENKIFASYISEKYRGSKIEKNNFPRAMVNIINGGAHAKTNLAFQEFMIFPRTNNIHDILRISCEIFYNLYDLLQEKGMLTLTGDEGGYAPNLSTAEEAIELILTAVKKAGYREYEDVMIAIDVAGNELMLSNNLYKISQTSEITSSELQEYYNILIKKYPIESIEDPFAEDDLKSWKEFTNYHSTNNLQIVADDLCVTNTKLIQNAIDNKLANTILIKPNQIGTITEVVNAINLAKKNNYKFIISHRSGETEDVTISHLALGLGGGEIKTGSVARGERTAKYNELIRLHEKFI